MKLTVMAPADQPDSESLGEGPKEPRALAEVVPAEHRCLLGMYQHPVKEKRATQIGNLLISWWN